MTHSPAFPCNQCGACCRLVSLTQETQFLDRGDGACRHYDDQNRLCTIYDTRPLICQVEKQYQLNYQQQYSWREFIDINRIACLELEKIAAQPAG
ncbi:YkgJ family cysteine cluster protein [Duffyella gerundensis]|uniref:YkgJ family cysteine cluster protein n=1 Tax=Duffyella TaxID=3026546 RepID=UPI003F6E0D9B